MSKKGPSEDQEKAMVWKWERVFQREDELGWHFCANTRPEGSVYSRGKDLLHLAN